MQAGEAKAEQLVGMHGCKNRDSLPSAGRPVCAHRFGGGGRAVV